MKEYPCATTHQPASGHPTNSTWYGAGRSSSVHSRHWALRDITQLMAMAPVAVKLPHCHLREMDNLSWMTLCNAWSDNCDILSLMYHTLRITHQHRHPKALNMQLPARPHLVAIQANSRKASIGCTHHNAILIFDSRSLPSSLVGHTPQRLT